MTDDLKQGMTDAEILAHYRRRYPFISLESAKGSYRSWQQFHHLKAQNKEKTS